VYYLNMIFYGIKKKKNKTLKHYFPLLVFNVYVDREVRSHTSVCYARYSVLFTLHDVFISNKQNVSVQLRINLYHDTPTKRLNTNGYK